MAYDVTSQWDDIHRQLGNYEELPVEKKQSEFTDEAIEKVEAYNALEKKSLDSLDSLEDDLDDEFLQKYKQQKLAELKQKASGPRFGYVREITRQDYIDHVNNAPKDVFVVLHLYHGYIEVCNLINQVFEGAAKKWTGVKFLKIVADKCIENYPEKNVPTMIIYKNGKMVKTLPRFDKLYRKITLFSLEDLLAKYKVVEKKEVDEEAQEIQELKSFAYKKGYKNKRKDSFSSDEEDRDDRGFMSNKMTFKYT